LSRRDNHLPHGLELPKGIGLKPGLHATAATDAIIFIDRGSIIHFANPAVEEVFDYKPDELIGKSLTILQPEALRGRHTEGIKRYVKTGIKKLNWRATETVGLRKDGAEIPVENG